MKLSWKALLATLLFAPLPAHALLGTEVGVRGGVWTPRLSGDLRLDGVGKGTTLDLRDDLDLDDSVQDGYVPYAEAFVAFGKNRLRVSGAKVDYSGSATFGSPVSFGDATFTGKVDSSLEYAMLDFVYERSLLDLENWLAGFSVAAVLDVKYLSGEAKLRSAAARASEDFRLPLPLVGLGAHLGVLADLLEVRAGAVGIGYRGNRVIDAFGEVVVSPFPFFDVGLGYRYFEVKVDSEDVFGGSGGLVFDYRQRGPYLNLTLKLGL